MRVVAAPMLSPNSSSSSSSSSSGVDTRVTCDADDHDQPSRYSWSYDVGGSNGAGTLGLRFEEKEHHATEVTATFPKKTKMTLFGPASRGAGIRLSSDRSFPLKNLDVNHYRLTDDANIYGSVPLVYAADLASEHKYTIGLFWLNGAAMQIRTGRQQQDGGIDSVTFSSEAGAGTLYVLPGPTAADVLVQYFSLTGAPQLPPLFSLGYHQCRWSYRDQRDVEEVNDKFSETQIPMDMIWLDIDHTNDKRYFTWDGRKFPDSKGMVAHLVASGRKLVTISDPHIKVDSGYSVYHEAHQQKYFVAKSSIGAYSEFHGHCWPGESAWIDFANPHARTWYATLFSTDKYIGSTLDVFTWNDMNEPSVFSGPQITMPMEAGQTNGVAYFAHKELHNMYGFHQTQATFAGHLYRSSGMHRPFLLTRSFFAGSQRYAAVWTGDNQANWDHLRGSVAMLMMHSMSGIVFIGADVGGFFDDPSEELHVRWYQLGCLYPFFRGHSHEQTKRREPWLYPGAVQRHIGDAIRFRYTLLPYLYTTFFEAHRFGAPIWRPRFFEFPQEESSYENIDQEESVLVGGALLAIPALHQGQTSTSTTLPKDAAYYNWWTGELYPGGSRVQFPVESTHEQNNNNNGAKPSAVLPLLLRAGTGIPILAESTDQILSSSKTSSSNSATKNPNAHNEVALVFALDATCAAEAYLYHDDGFSTDFSKSTNYFCTRSAFASMVGSGTLSINVTTAAERGSVASSAMPSIGGGRQSGMQRLVGTCDHGKFGPTISRVWAAMKPLRYMDIKRIRIMTSLCPRIPEGSVFSPEILSYTKWSSSSSNTSSTSAQSTWVVRQVADHIFEAEGSSLSHLCTPIDIRSSFFQRCS
ncbi:glycoside hydrolase family 31, putative [Bodo saltans]|uniref:Glycoside hydrolase family 31, putative n=1 Tax=Bodo saltans TaxID=75058 RepID=A0A0S4ITP0_BODSA|nr:glycoside hydrolase family 31, putative [Bodo saltans]|eukprot:CUF77657.1 glycoside hydrolase family 31, putative [Bodo saltans]